jgi:hypothetical protein
MQLQFITTILFLFVSLQISAQGIHTNTKMKSVIDFDKNYYFAQEETNLWGLCSADAEFVIQAEYDTLYPLSEVEFEPTTYALSYSNTKFIIGKKGKNYDLLDLKGNKKMRVNGIMPRLMRNNVILVQNGGKWGLGKTSGEMLVATQSTAIDWFGDLLGLQENNAWTLFNPKSGGLISYDNVIRTSENEHIGLFFVKKGSNWGAIDDNAKIVVPIEYNSISSILGQKSSFVVEQNSKFGIYNIEQQKLTLPTAYSKLESPLSNLGNSTNQALQQQLLYKVQ